MSENDSQILIYQSSEGNIRVDVHLEDESVWLTQAQMAMLFDKSNKTISEHVASARPCFADIEEGCHC